MNISSLSKSILATCIAADSRSLAVRANSTGSLALKDWRSHPEEAALLLPVPREAAAVEAAPPDEATPLVEERGRPRLREVHADNHVRPLGWQDGPSRSSSRHEQGRVVPRQPDPIHHIVREVVDVRAHQPPPWGGLPQA